mgnify:FL=1
MLTNANSVIQSIPFAQVLGLKLVNTTSSCVIGMLDVTNRLTTGKGTMHGGAVMSLADTLGAIGTMANLPEGASTTTIESKTNFIAAIPEGDTVKGVCTPLHLGRTTMVWQTNVVRADGKTAAVITQTQLVMFAKGTNSSDKTKSECVEE